MREPRRRPLFRLPWRTERRIREDVEAEIRFHLAAAVGELVDAGMSAAGARAAARRRGVAVAAAIRFHRAAAVDALVDAGMSAEGARAEALRRFGNVDEARSYMAAVDRGTEAAQRRSDWMRDFRQDLLYALRKLRSAPAFTLTAVLTLALGIGANTAIFSVVNGVLLKPLPFPQPERLVRVWSANRTEGLLEGAVSAVDLDDWRARRRAFADIGGYWYQEGGSGADLTGDGEPLRISVTYAEPGFFPALGVPAAIGRVPREDEMHRGGDDRVIVLSDAFWRRKYHADRAVVGGTVTIGGEPYRVIGVMPRSFTYPSDMVDAYIPYSTIPDKGIPRIRLNRVLEVVARLAPGVTIDQARADLATTVRALAQQYPEDKAWDAATVAPLRDVIVGKARTGILVLLGAVAFVLLLACANLASLLLARATVRERELAIRSALGAGRGRIVRQLLTESVVLSLVGGAAGVALAVVGTRALVALGSRQLPRAAEIGLEPAVLVFALVLSLVTGVLFGLAPAMRAASADLNGALRDGRGNSGGRGHRARAALVIGEVAIAVLLVVGAGLMTRSFVRLLRVNLGFRPDHVLVVNFSISDDHPRPDGFASYYTGILDRVRSLPGVVAAGGAKAVPLRGKGERIGFTPEGTVRNPGDEPEYTPLLHVSEGYFRALGVPIVAGREFERRDDSRAPLVLLVNEAFARKYFKGRQLLGHTIDAGDEHVPIVGVVGDVRQDAVEDAAKPTVYIHALQNSRSRVNLVVRTRGQPLALASAVRNAIRELDPNQTITATFTLESALSEAIARPRLLATLLALFGVLGLLLGAVGLYGVLAYLVTQRTREIGVRMALGADRSAVLAMVVGRGLRLAGAGLAVGLVAALLLTRFMQAVLFGIEPTDPLTFVTVAVALLGVALLASWLPARRAAHVDPLIAMRAE